MRLTKTFRGVFAAVMFFSLIISLASAQDGWHRINVSPIPSARGTHAMIYHGANSRLVLFGGFGETGTLQDTWEFLGDQWQQVNPTVKPPARSLHTFTYYPPEKSGILIGGNSSSFAPLGDAWKYANGKWTQIPIPVPTPMPRHSHAAAYDSTQNAIFFYGGRGPNSIMIPDPVHYPSLPYLGDFWMYRSGKFTKVETETAPPELYGHAMAYFADRQELVLFGGADKYDIQHNQTWIFKNGDWALLETPNSPAPRVYHEMVYDAEHQRILLFGGLQNSISLNDLWSFNGYTWTKLSPYQTPSIRSKSAFAYDTDTNLVYCFGGIATEGFQTTYLGDHWVFQYRNAYFDKPVYDTLHDKAIVTIEDFSANTNFSVIDEINVRISSMADKVGFNLTLYETGPATGIFRNERAQDLIKFSLTQTDPAQRILKV
ncbi:MAG TPA: kelch repeat-containing protein, partial [Candidatus Sumerlaeia bacterium]|nr:kelch repeat-containing protein [Candidatus Sumerlaeia bacterium]